MLEALEDKTIFESMIKRSSTGFDTSVYSFGEEHALPPRNKPIKIATISSSITAFGSNSHLCLTDFPQDHSLLLSKLNKRQRTAWANFRLKELDTALKQGANIICFSELAYPNPSDNATGTSGGSSQKLSLQGEDFSIVGCDFYERARDLLEKHKSSAFTFLGSFHCTKSLYNVGVIFPQGMHTNSVHVDRIANQWAKNPVKRKSSVTIPLKYLKKYPLDSNFKCNTDVLSECLDRRQVSEAFSGCGVVGPCDVLDIAFGELAEADFPGQASADDAICVFDRASLPGGMRITEEGPDRQCLVAVEFATVVEGDGLSGFWGHAQEQVG